MLSKLSHRNIIKFYGVIEKPPSVCLVTGMTGNPTEYEKNIYLVGNQPQSTLQMAPYRRSYTHTTWSTNTASTDQVDLILDWAHDIALGVNYLHEEAPLKIIHRDLKSTNVVITHDMICKICDFGTSIFNLKTTKMSLIGTVSFTLTSRPDQNIIFC